LDRNSLAKSEAITEQLIVNNDIIPNKTSTTLQYRSSSNADDTPTGSSSMNESLERIGTLLQQLIEEAQESLVNPRHQAQFHHEDDLSTGKSLSYIQSRYIQSQTKLALALDQLEKSLQYIPTIMMAKESMTQEHYYHPIFTPNYNHAPPKSPFKMPWATLGLVLALLVYSLQRPKPTTKYHHIQVSLLLLVMSSIYRRLRLKHPIMSIIDYCLLRLNLSRGTPAICGFIHRLNFVLCLLLHK
jgi:hypothetical protein